MLIHLHVSLRVPYLIDRYICRMQTDRKKSAHQKQVSHILLQNLEKADTPNSRQHVIASELISKPKNRLQQPHRCKTDTQKPAHPGPWATMDYETMRGLPHSGSGNLDTISLSVSRRGCRPTGNGSMICSSRCGPLRRRGRE